MNGLPHPNVEYPPGKKLDDRDLAEFISNVQTNFDALGTAAESRATATKWLTPALLGSWANYQTNGEYDMCFYRRGSDGRVHIKGLVKSGAWTEAGGAEAKVFLLPIGYRPPRHLIFTQWFSANSGASIGILRVDVQSTGYVVARGGGVTTIDFMSLNLSFFSS